MRTVRRLEMAADRAVAGEIVVAARKAPRRNRAGALEHDVGRVHDEEHLAPGGQGLHDLLEVSARHDRGVLGGKRAHHLEGRHPIVARDLLQHAVGALRQPLGQGRAGDHSAATRRTPPSAVTSCSTWKPSNSGWPSVVGLLYPARACALRKASDLVQASKSAWLLHTVWEA